MRIVSRPVPRGFTLIELVVTFVVLGVLTALGMFAYQGFVGSAGNTDALERLRSVAAREQVFARDFGAYTAVGSDLPRLSGAATLVTGDSTGPEEVSAAVGTQGDLGLAVRSASGSCLYLTVAPLLTGGDVRTVRGVPDGAACSGARALPDGQLPLPPQPVTD